MLCRTTIKWSGTNAYKIESPRDNQPDPPRGTGREELARDNVTERLTQEAATNPSESDSDHVPERLTQEVFRWSSEELSTASSSGVAAKEETTPVPSGAEASVGPVYCSAAGPLDMISFTYVVGETPKGTLYVQFERRHDWFKPAPGDDWVENCNLV